MQACRADWFAASYEGKETNGVDVVADRGDGVLAHKRRDVVGVFNVPPAICPTDGVFASDVGLYCWRESPR